MVGAPLQPNYIQVGAIQICKLANLLKKTYHIRFSKMKDKFVEVHKYQCHLAKQMLLGYYIMGQKGNSQK